MRYQVFFCLVLFFSNTKLLFGQSDYFRTAIFHNLTVNDGLGHRTANVIAQDQAGYLWVGTNNGLNRYDGRKMKVYRWDIKDPFSLPNNLIVKLFTGKNGRLWIVSEAGDLCWYDASHDRFITLDLKIEEQKRSLKTRDLTEDKDGNIWIVARNNEMYKLGLKEASPSTPDLFPQVNGDFPPINKIVIDPQNRLWMETSNDGIHLYSISENGIQAIRQFKGLGNLRIFEQDHEHTLWFSSGLKIYKTILNADPPEMKAFCDIKEIIPEVKASVSAICQDKKGQVWISLFGFGLLQLKEVDGSIKSSSYPGTSKMDQGLANNHLRDLFIDKYNVLWIGSEAGIFWHHLNQKPFHLISKTSDHGEWLINNIVHAIYRDQNLWIGTREGLSVMDTATGKFYNYQKLSNENFGRDEGPISSFLKDTKGRLWIGTELGGLFVVKYPDNIAKLSFLPLGQTPVLNSNFSNSYIRSIVEDEFGRIWVGTAFDGIYFLARDQKNDNDFFEFTKVKSLNVNAITNLYKDPYENTIWAGTWGGGLVRIRINSPDNYVLDSFQHEEDNANSLSFDRVNPIVKTDRETLWAGTIGGGLNKIVFDSEDSLQYRHYTIHDGLPDNTIHSISKDDTGMLWLGGTGLTRFDPKTEKITFFDKHDGLQSNLFIVKANFKDIAGRLYFGGPNGVNIFNPDQIHKEESLPDIIISGLKILNKEIKVGDELNGRIVLPQAINQTSAITIKEKENDLTIDFQAIHTASPSKNRLKYRLQGHQQDWIDVEGPFASINYSNLKPKDYSFQVMASNGDGIWNQEITQLSIKILPYWYKTQLAYIIYVLLFLFLLWLFRRAIIIQSNLRNNLRIAQIEIEKDHELAKMKTRFFNNITHELRTPLTLIKSPVEELLTNEYLSNNVRKNYYYIIHQNARKLFHLVNRLLDFRKAESGHFQLEAARGNFIPFVKEIYLSFAQLAKDKGIEYAFETEHDELPLFYDRDKIEIVLCNLLSNAFKYSSRGDAVKLLIRQQDEFCIVEVSDTGKGMSPEEVDNIFNRFYQIAKTESSDIIGTGIGLSMVKSIADLHQGEVSVQTQPGQGSTFTFRLPVGRAHLADDQIISDFADGEHIHSYQSSIKTDASLPKRSLHSEQLQKLLIVEDNPEIRAFIKSIFADQFEIEEASHGLEGLASLKKSIPDIIISDIMMDQMDGIAFCNKVKEDQSFFHIPFILLTARTSNVYKVDGLSSGADAYITKPFNAQVLKAQVNSLLKTRASLKEYFTNRITLGPKEINITSEEVEFLEELIAIIEEKLEEENLTAENLASAMAMSHSTLYRKVKSYTGESINSFIRSIRLKQAAQLLSGSKLNISQIAYQVGFSDVNYFRKCFKQQFGMTPTTYTKSFTKN